MKGKDWLKEGNRGEWRRDDRIGEEWSGLTERNGQEMR